MPTLPDLPLPVLLCLSTVTTFCGVFLKGFQHKNVIGNHIKSVFWTSWAMAMFDVISLYAIVKGGLYIAFSAGLGASFGMVTSIRLHDRIFKGKSR